MNFAKGEVIDGQVAAPGLAPAPFPVNNALPAEGAPVWVGVRPGHLRIVPGDTHAVDITESLGSVSYVHVDGPEGARFVVELPEAAEPPGSQRIGLDFDTASVFVFDGETDARLR